jgi:hypothetical protein
MEQKMLETINIDFVDSNLHDDNRFKIEVTNPPTTPVVLNLLQGENIDCLVDVCVPGLTYLKEEIKLWDVKSDFQQVLCAYQHLGELNHEWKKNAYIRPEEEKVDQLKAVVNAIKALLDESLAK